MILPMVGNTTLRMAITRNLVSFPSQIQSFMRRGSGDLRARVVQLYFVRGWRLRRICDRYGLSRARAHKFLTEWRIRAIECGRIQEIEPGSLERLIGDQKQMIMEEGAATDSARAMAAGAEFRAPLLLSGGARSGM